MVKKIANKFVLILSSSVFLVISAHILLYLILCDVLSFLPNFPYVIVFVALGFSFGSIFLTQFLVSRFDNKYTSAYYFVVAAWLAFAWQAFLIYTLLVIFRFIFAFQWLVDPSSFAWFFLFLTVILSAIGFRNAFSPHLKNIIAEIENLPDFWVNKKIVQLSDVHLGAVYRHGFLSKIARLVGKVEPEMVLITGDLFDGTDGDFSEAGKKLLELHAPLGVYLIFGNHENYLGRAEVVGHLAGSGIEVLDDRLVEIKGLQILGVGYPEEGTHHLDLAGKLKSLENFDSKKPSILMFHEPIQFEQVAETGVNIYLAGHTHRGQMFPFNLLAYLVYHRYSFGLKKFKQLTAFISTGAGTWGPPCRTLSRSEIVVITLLRK
ncbi:MAG: metallophosphoesterase [Patescibacteria group bacterium]